MCSERGGAPASGMSYSGIFPCDISLSAVPLFLSLRIAWLWASFLSGRLCLHGWPSNSQHTSPLQFLGASLNGMIWIPAPTAVAKEWGVWLGHVCILGSQQWGASNLNSVDWRWEGGRSLKANQITVGRQKSPVSTLGLVQNQQLRRWMISHSENLSVSCWTELLSWDTVLTPALQKETGFFLVFLI